MSKIDDPDMSMADVRHASEIVRAQREGVLGKAVDAPVTININPLYELSQLIKANSALPVVKDISNIIDADYDWCN